MNIVVVDYGSGNLRSAAKAVERAAAEADIAIDLKVSAQAEDVARADRIVLPGQGAFADCRYGLAGLDGMDDALTHAVIALGRPLLGICVGMQLLASVGLEHGRHAGYGWIPGHVVPIDPPSIEGERRLKIPHMGWNELILDQPAHPLMAGLADGDHSYFVHSYHFVAEDQAARVAHTFYGREVAAVVAAGNIVGTQFHPEKSQQVGLRIMRNFLNWRP